MAEAHYALGQHRECLMVATAGIRAEPKLREDPRLLYLMGQARLAIGEVQLALLTFQEAAKADPKATRPLLDAAAVTLKHLDFAATVKLLEQVLERDPRNYEALYSLPVALRRIDRSADALTVLDRAVGLHSDRPELHYNRCVISQGVLTKSRAEVERALKACEEAVSNVSGSTSMGKELRKRVDGLRSALEFMEPDKPAGPGGEVKPAEKPPEVKPAEDKPAAPTGEARAPEDKPAEKPAEDKPAEDKPAEKAPDRPAEDKPAEDKPPDDKPPAPEEPPEDKPGEDEPPTDDEPGEGKGA
jgi:tetratricopeptide (TPR) repeat protein